MLNTQHLTTFKVLVETGSFTKTAQRLGLTQPAVSQHIQKLERGLNEPLLVRHGRTTVITSAGKLLLRHIEELEGCYCGFKEAWQDFLQSEKTTLDA
ncbi:LysR family transcriptional regulator [Marinomonas algarum]|uniref:LysR family transcriptional regulator n=1 Tax=Marinomonas algarum TaxID=2883105 RepID=A0A9X1LCB9_9GAMM|nr:LysR family transcriptional regulator [Marinomonas algarum]MCB5161337.1 LysR family transcriptional regulator [Marinomonas algarum]